MKWCRLTRNAEWEVQTRQHYSGKDPPSAHTRDEGEGARCNLQPPGESGVAVVELVVRASEAAKSDDEGEEDHEEDDVGADGADEVDEAHDAHGDEEES